MKKSLILVLAFALFNSGCITASLVYRNADWYLQHKINSYASFNTRQKETIRREVSDYMRWHRKNALPEYIIFLQNLNGVAQYQGRLKGEQAGLLRAQLMSLYRETLTPAINPLALLLSSLDSPQIRQLDKTFAEEIHKQKQDETEGSYDENLDKRADKTLSFVKSLAGTLNKDQESNIREMSRHLPFVSPLYIQSREANQHRLITLLNNHASPDEIAAFLSLWILTPETLWNPYQQRAYKSFEKDTDEMVARIHDLLTPQQRAHIHKTIAAYIDDMRHYSTDITAASNVSRLGQ